MKYKLYTTSQKAWDGMIKEIRKAERFIYLEMYILSDNTKQTHDFFSLFKEKAQAGVEVVIIIDKYGSYALKNKIIQELREAGVEVLYFDKWFKRTHRKILIIDNQVAFLGGVNIKEYIRDWHDLQIRLKGKIVKPIIISFSKSYYRCGGQKESILRYRNLVLSKKIKSWIADNWSKPSNRYYLNNYYQERISKAKESIKIVTPYLVPPRWLIKELDRASQRGVEIEIIIPQQTDIRIINKANYLNCCRLTPLGIKFYLSPKMNHAKLMLIDNQEGIIGSQNLDVLSFNYLAEVGVFFKQKKLISDLIKIIDQWKKGTTPFGDRCNDLSLLDYVLINVLKLFYPIF